MANQSTITYDGRTLFEVEESGNVAITYNSETLATLAAGSSRTLNCANKYMVTNLVIGSKTLNCAGKLMKSNVGISVISLFPSEPTSYELISKYTSSQTWTAPENGYYQIEVFGASGNGGTGYINAIYGSYGKRYSGGGGGGGGYACSKVTLNKGDIITLTVGAVGKTTSAVVDSSHNDSYDHTLSVTSGANGGSGEGGTAGSAGKGGVASGGNVDNKNGSNGKTGTSQSSYSMSAISGGAGGATGYTGGNKGGAGADVNETAAGTAGSGSAGFIKIYRGNTNLSGGNSGGTSGGTSNAVFYIESLDGNTRKSFEFEEGMTWSEFLASSYKDENFVLEQNQTVTLMKAGYYAGSTVTANVLAYGGYVLFTGDAIKTGVIETTAFIYHPEQDKSDMTESELAMVADVLLIENGKTYYCDGV